MKHVIDSQLKLRKKVVPKILISSLILLNTGPGEFHYDLPVFYHILIVGFTDRRKRGQNDANSGRLEVCRGQV